MRLRSERLFQRIADFAVPWGVGAFLALVVLDEQAEPNSSLLVLLGVGLAILQGGALRWRHRYPERVMAVALVAGLGYLLLVPSVVVPVAGLFAIFALACVRPPRDSLPWLLALIALVSVNLFVADVDDRVGDTSFTIGIAIGAWALGESVRNRRVAIREEARRAVGEEQARIARELHDVIAHSVSGIVVQAGAADDVFDERPDQARAALRSIERAGRDALGELRRLLSAVRPGDPDPAAPQPGLAGIAKLAEPLRAVGLQVVVREHGPRAQLPAGVDLYAYRIVQEALTNTLRHANATRAEVSLRYDPEAIEIEVRDNGRGALAGHGNGSGHGLMGMRERAALLGGTLDAGPVAGGGFRVHARLPLDSS
jgi:signal transduction histidine kinase